MSDIEAAEREAFSVWWHGPREAPIGDSPSVLAFYGWLAHATLATLLRSQHRQENEAIATGSREARLSSKWVVGAMDRGMGHYNFAVIVQSDSLGTDKPIVTCPDRDTAEHIVKVHNDALDNNAVLALKAIMEMADPWPDRALLAKARSIARNALTKLGIL